MKLPVAPRNRFSVRDVNWLSAINRLMKGSSFSFFRAAVAVVTILAGGLTFSAAATDSAAPASTLHKKRLHKKTATSAVKPGSASVSAFSPNAAPAGKAQATGSSTSMTVSVGGAASAPKRKRAVYAQTWDEPTYKDSTALDKVDGEDLVVRKAAADALGPLNGSVVVVEPGNGRILTIVNQPLALSDGYQPCSTVKISVALAALNEKLITRLAPVRFTSRSSMDLTSALAYSNNYYFANLGTKLGYDRTSYYAHLYGYGEKAGLDIPGEHAGSFPTAPPREGGMGMLTSFGEEISQTPLEFAALMSAVENGGTLWWLQYPRTPEEIAGFQPQVKRKLDISKFVDDLKPGLRGAVEFGTAKRAHQDDVILGKTGTCSEGRTHLGWFGSFNETGARKIVVVVMLTGGRISIGATAAEVAGDVYKRLAAENYFKSVPQLTPAAILSPPLIGAQ